MLSKLSTRISIIYSALLKHDYANFSLDILEYCEINILIEREQYYLDHLKPEYNILKVANSRLGSKQSEMTKIKISISKKGINHPFFGKIHTYETRKKIGLSLRAIVRVNNKPKVVTNETKLLLSSRSHGVSVMVFNESNKLVNKFPTIISVAKYFDVDSRTIRRYIENNKPYNGYTFKPSYKDTYTKHKPQ